MKSFKAKPGWECSKQKAVGTKKALRQINVRSAFSVPTAFCLLPSFVLPPAPAACSCFSSPRLPGEDSAIDALRVTKHDEANIAHILLSHALDI